MNKSIYIYLQFLVIISLLVACDNVNEESFINEDPQKELTVFFLQNDQIIVQQNQEQLILFLQNDSIPKKVDISFSSSKYGTVSLQNVISTSSITSITDYAITYVPNKNFIGNDSIVYTLCDDNGTCKMATIYITVKQNTINICDFTIPLLNDVKILPNKVDSFLLDFSHISCPLSLSIEGDIKGWINNKEVNKNKFLINYKSPEKGGFHEKIQLKICDSLNNICKKSMMLYDVKPIFCSDWLAKDDSFTIEKDSITIKPLTISKQKLYSNDNYCFDKDIKFSITQFPNNGKLVISKNELMYYPDPISSNFEKDIFTYKICNEHNQCSQAYVKLTLNR